MSISYFKLILIWFLYLGSHSLFAANRFKSWVAGFMGDAYRYYRLIYVIYSTVALAAIGIYLSWLWTVWLYPVNIISAASGMVLISWGFSLGEQSFKTYRLDEFLGVAYIKEGIKFRDILKTSGLLARVRHPLYTATLMIVIGFLLALPAVANLISVVCIVIYLFIGIGLEEKKLISEYGDNYREYRRSVPMLFPKIRLIRNRYPKA